MKGPDFTAKRLNRTLIHNAEGGIGMILAGTRSSWLVKALLVCIAAATMATAQTAVIGDCENGTNQNNFGAYWYVYTDFEDGGNSEISNADPNGDGTYEFTVTEGEGCPSGTAGYGARMDYTLGDTDPGSGSVTWGSSAGVGTMLALEGEVCDITGAETITYWAKADPPVDIRVEIATSVVEDFCYHHTIHSIGSSWEKFTITLSEPLGIQQYSWGEEVAFDPTKVEKVQWAISEDEGATENSSGSIWIDDVKIQPYTFVPADACESCVSAPGAVPGDFLLADMEETQNGLGYYTYCYNDVGERSVSSPEDYSEIFEGVDNDDPEIPILILDGGEGYDNTEGAYIGFQLGPTYQEGSNTILPFVGIGTNLADELGLSPFNAQAAGAPGVDFMYKTTGDYEYVALEVETDQDFGNPGAVYYVKLPATEG
ncbi:MAG: hypothetical protein GF410_11140, partial [Chitinivibrionales bacterium]|nr:hypothetical protein [Chitinivibrionales bacterium]